MKLFIRHIFKKWFPGCGEKKFPKEKELKNYGSVVKVVVFPAESHRFNSSKTIFFPPLFPPMFFFSLFFLFLSSSFISFSFLLSYFSFDSGLKYFICVYVCLLLLGPIGSILNLHNPQSQDRY